MTDANFVIITGTVLGNPYVAQTGNGRTILTFRLKSVREYTWQNENKTTSTTAEIQMFGKEADAVAHAVGEGRRVEVHGSLRTQAVQGDGDRKNFKLVVEARELNFLAATQTAAGQAMMPASAPRPAQGGQPQARQYRRKNVADPFGGSPDSYAPPAGGQQAQGGVPQEVLDLADDVTGTGSAGEPPF